MKFKRENVYGIAGLHNFNEENAYTILPHLQNVLKRLSNYDQYFKFHSYDIYLQ